MEQDRRERHRGTVASAALPTEAGFDTAFIVSAAALTLAFIAALLIPRRRAAAAVHGVPASDGPDPLAAAA